MNLQRKSTDRTAFVLSVTASARSAQLKLTVTEKEFRQFLARDSYCLHCGLSDDTLVPQHRRNRGMGGSHQRRSKPSNIIVLCSSFNYTIEAVSEASVTAQQYGWKLRAGQEPEDTPVYDSYSGNWYLLFDDYSRIITKGPQN
jgi:hypothetical protein